MILENAFSIDSGMFALYMSAYNNEKVYISFSSQPMETVFIVSVSKQPMAAVHIDSVTNILWCKPITCKITLFISVIKFCIDQADYKQMENNFLNP